VHVLLPQDDRITQIVLQQLPEGCELLRSLEGVSLG
jgi:hypothetical protein